MNFIVKTTPEELQRARKWWHDLELQWKHAYNEAVFGKGPVLEPPGDEELMLLLIRVDTLRFAGPGAINPNLSTVLTNLSGLIPLYHLTYLSLSNARLDNLQDLRRFTRMRFLFVYDNGLRSLEGIEGMTGLEELYAQGNRIESLEPVRHLTRLKTLYVTRNKLTRIDGLTSQHADRMKKFFVEPNEDLPDREILRVQNELGIICRTG